MKRFFVNLVAGLSALMIFFFFILPIVFAGFLAASISSEQQVKLPDELVLKIDLRVPMTDQPVYSPFDFSGNQAPSLISLLNTLEAAENDDRIKGIFIEAGGMSGVGLSMADEIRDALKSFKAKDKFVVAYAQTLFSTGMGTYSAISEADEIWLQESGVVATSGVAIGSMFLADLLEKIDAKPQMSQYKEYKSMADMYTRSEFSDAHRESYEFVLDSLYGTALASIAQSKGRSVEDIKATLNQSPYLASEAVEAGLVDNLGYSHAAQSAALSKAGEDAEFVSLGDYQKQMKAAPGGEGTLAVIYAEGSIHSGKSTKSGNSSIGSETYAEAIRNAADDEDVSAILMRVSSGGGSADASDEIWDAVNYAKDQGKPVVVSMGSIAASGGYYMSMNADSIVASPNTITGSIGLVMGKMDLSGTYNKVGINIEMIERGGPNTMLLSTQSEFTEEQWKAWQKLGTATYEDFVGKAAMGRDMSHAELEEVAKGRIWTGEQGLENGLVDKLGGYRVALAETKSLAGFEEGAEVTLKQFPREKEPVELFMEAFGMSAQAANVLLRFSNVEHLDRVMKAWDLANTDQAEIQLETKGLIIE